MYNRKTWFNIGCNIVYGHFGKPWKKWYPMSRKKNNVYWVNSNSGGVCFYKDDRLVVSGGEKKRLNFSSNYYYIKYLNNSKKHDPNLENV